MPKRIPNLLLRRAREERGWNQEELAEKIGADFRSVSRWETGAQKTNLYYQQRLCELFKKTPEELGFLASTEEIKLQQSDLRTLHEQEKPYPPLWNVPIPVPIALFVGRKDILQRLHDALLTKEATALTQAISGLGGIGKTLTAAQYAYTYRGAYDAVLWVDASSRASILSSLTQIAGLLKLPARKSKDQANILAAVKEWMKEHAHWLLILDNVEDMTLVNEVLPPTRIGHILLTTRAQATRNFIFKIEIGDLTPEEGALLLLRRANLLPIHVPLEEASEDDRTQALYLSRLMEGLPLALDQAGAYIQEIGCSLLEYIQLYEKRQIDLLKWHSSVHSDEEYVYPYSVAATLSLSFEKVKQASAAATDLLRLYAFLASDAIPESIVMKGASELGPHLGEIRDKLVFDQMIAELRKYSLVRRYSRKSDEYIETMVSIHRLVQAVFKDDMGEQTRQEWARKTVRAVYRTWCTTEANTYLDYEQYIPHVQACAELINYYGFVFEEAIALLSVVAIYLREKAWYTLAETFTKQALSISEEAFGAENEQVAHCLTNLALIYQEQENYQQAKTLFDRVLHMSKKVWGVEHHNVASCLHNLAHLCRLQGDYTEALSYYQQALTLRRKVLAPNDPAIAVSLNGLATLHNELGMYDQAEALNEQALSIRQELLNREDLELAASYHNTATTYVYQKKYDQAETFCKQALEIFEKVMGKDHPWVAQALNTLAEIYSCQGKYNQAESLFQQSLDMRRKAFGPTHTDVAQTLLNLGALYENQEKYEDAERYYQQALTMMENALGESHVKVMIVLLNYKSLLQKMGRESEVQALAKRIQEIQEVNTVYIDDEQSE